MISGCGYVIVVMISLVPVSKSMLSTSARSVVAGRSDAQGVERGRVVGECDRVDLVDQRAQLLPGHDRNCPPADDRGADAPIGRPGVLAHPVGILRQHHRGGGGAEVAA